MSQAPPGAEFEIDSEGIARFPRFSGGAPRRPASPVDLDDAYRSDRAQRQERWARAGSVVAEALMADAETSPWLVSARAARRAAGTTAAAVWLPADGPERTGFQIGAYDGAEPDVATVALISSQAFCRRVALARAPVLENIGAAVLVVPLLAADRVFGLLTLPAGERDSLRHPAEQRMIATFCGQTALACQLVESRGDQAQVATYADRDRVARDLHDQVIQQLFGAGLLLAGLEHVVPAGPADRVREVVERLDRTIVDIRRFSFSLPISGGEFGSATKGAQAVLPLAT
jgi:signal transduction histidine kinase